MSSANSFSRVNGDGEYRDNEDEHVLFFRGYVSGHAILVHLLNRHAHACGDHDEHVRENVPSPRAHANVRDILKHESKCQFPLKLLQEEASRRSPPDL